MPHLIHTKANQMKNKFLPTLAFFFLLSVPIVSYSQAPALGALTKFLFFTSDGAIGNTQRSRFTGEVGTNVGAVTGFGNVDGVIHFSPDGATLAASAALATAAVDITSRTSTGTHAPAFET